MAEILALFEGEFAGPGLHKGERLVDHRRGGHHINTTARRVTPCMTWTPAGAITGMHTD
jgi:hypothetical protein